VVKCRKEQRLTSLFFDLAQNTEERRLHPVTVQGMLPAGEERRVVRSEAARVVD
jgi:hypothetical protein